MAPLTDPLARLGTGPDKQSEADQLSRAQTGLDNRTELGLDNRTELARGRRLEIDPEVPEPALARISPQEARTFP